MAYKATTKIQIVNTLDSCTESDFILSPLWDQEAKLDPPDSKMSLKSLAPRARARLRTASESQAKHAVVR